MAQDTTPAIVCYQGTGSNRTFPVPFDKGYYGEVKVLFVRRGLADYTYYPSEDDYVVNGRLYAWINGTTKVYTHTPNPSVSAKTYDAQDVEQEDTVSAIAGQTITVDGTVYSRSQSNDISSNLILTWNGDMLEVGDFICIIRDTQRGQPYVLPNNQKHIERALDNLERQIQEVKDATDVSLKVDPSYDIEDSHKMNPIDWLETILRSTDKSVRALRYANGWLDYSFDDPNIADADKTWNHLVSTENIKSIREQSYVVDDVTYYRTQYMASDGTWKTLSDPSKWDNMKLADLKDTAITSPVQGHFLMYNGTRWVNSVSTGTVGWGAILGDITDQSDLMAKFTEYVRTDGTSIMAAPLKMRASESFKCAIAPSWDGVGFFKLNDNDSVTLMASMEETDGLTPATNNKYNIGKSAYRWKNLYLAGSAYISKINNGYDISVPVTNSPQTLALKSEVDLAANSGRMITDQGVWYAKMYAATVVPTGAEYDGRNYADFSQVDSDNNPVIKIYTGASGAWTLTDTITPPAEYDGYVPITSKIWDIAEQAGQQGGRILWNHQSKDFTPYPQIISYENIEVTGNSTVIMPASSGDNQIVNKKFVEDLITGVSDFDLFDTKWRDATTSNTRWALSDGEWKTNANAYQHLVDDAEGMYDEAEFSVATQNANLGNNSWNDVAYGNGKFVALGNSGYISTSTDGINWITAIQDANLGSHIWSNIAYGNGRFVALGTTGYISTSTDGTTWTAATQDENIKNKMWWGVVYGNGKFVALTYSGYISTSTDGTTWTATTQDANLGNNTWRGIAYDGTKFVALGKDGHISTSTDGTTWTTATQNANLGSNNWYEITYDGTNFVALGKAGYISTSTDGTTWTAAEQDANLGNNSWHSIAYGNETLVALGDTGYVSTASNFESETIAGTTIIYYAADDGHKIVLPDQETNVNAIYTATGSAWYYILDTANERFKLPRSKHNKYADSLGVAGNGMTLGMTNGTTNYGTIFSSGSTGQQISLTTGSYGGNLPNTDNTGTRPSDDQWLGVTSDPTKSGMVAQQEQDTDQYKYLYFYVGA